MRMVYVCVCTAELTRVYKVAKFNRPAPDTNWNPK